MAILSARVDLPVASHHVQMIHVTGVFSSDDISTEDHRDRRKLQRQTSYIPYFCIPAEYWRSHDHGPHAQVLET